MRDKLEKIIKAYEELEKKLSDPAVASDIKEFTRLNKEYAHQSDLIAASREYIGALDDIEAAKEMLHDTTDADEKEMLQMDISENEEKLTQLAEDIKYMLIPSDPNDDKNTIVEIRSAAGGDEAAIFAGDLYKMYQRFCESRGWKTTVLDSSPSEAGGFKSIEFKVEGDRVYSVMKYESGVHRVQRVPKTESQGRIQTSTATVAVLPEAEEIDVQINQSDLRIDTYCASGPGGQCVNTTYSAVRITHLPTNTVVLPNAPRFRTASNLGCVFYPMLLLLETALLDYLVHYLPGAPPVQSSARRLSRHLAVGAGLSAGWGEGRPRRPRPRSPTRAAGTTDPLGLHEARARQAQHRLPRGEGLHDPVAALDLAVGALLDVVGAELGPVRPGGRP